MYETFNIRMTKLNRNRDITVYLPDDYYNSDMYYPVLYIQDGQNAFFDELSYSGVSWGFGDYASSHDLKIIMVAIPCNFEGEKRNDEYGPWIISREITLRETGKDIVIGGEGVLYIEWMVEELKPFIDHKYRTIVDDTSMIGSSSGATITSYACFRYPRIFKKVANLSTAYWFYWDEFKELIESSDLSSVEKFYMDVGGHENDHDLEINQWYKDVNDYIYSLIKDKISNIEYRYFEDAHHNEWEWRQRLPYIMEYLYGGK